MTIHGFCHVWFDFSSICKTLLEIVDANLRVCVYLLAKIFSSLCLHTRQSVYMRVSDHLFPCVYSIYVHSHMCMCLYAVWSTFYFPEYLKSFQLICVPLCTYVRLRVFSRLYLIRPCVKMCLLYVKRFDLWHISDYTHVVSMWSHMCVYLCVCVCMRTWMP